MRRCLFLMILGACGGSTAQSPDAPIASADAPAGASRLPLADVSDVPLPGGATRFDYQELDHAKNQLVVAHMNDNSVLVLDATDGSVKKLLPNIPTPRGVVVADDVGVIFVTSTPGHVVLIDNVALSEITRVTTGTAPDGDGWDPDDKILGVSDQGDGALSLIANSGMGTRTQVAVGSETGNVVYDPSRKHFWITAVQSSPPDQLVEVDPTTASITTRIDLPGCDGAHGLRLHPDGQSAFIACENNDKLARVDLGGAHTVSLGATGAGPDVLALDPGLGWLYVAAESGDLTVFDISKPGVSLLGHDQPGANSHTVAVDPATHRVFFPLPRGTSGMPVLRIMQPTPG